MTSASEPLRIGGEFGLSLDMLLQPPHHSPPTLSTPCTLWTDTGRSGLLLAALDILQRGGEPVAWLPAFACRSLSQVFQQAGYAIRYYGCEELHSIPNSPPDPRPGQTLVLIHYFGRLNSTRSPLARRCRSSGIYLIEDAVQATLSQPIGAAGDYVVTSLRKFLPQPDGALVGSHEPLRATLAAPDEAFLSARIMAKLMRESGASADKFLPLIDASESRLDGPIQPRDVSWFAQQLMARTDIESIAERRRENHLRLYEFICAELEGKVEPVLGQLMRGEIPLGCPVRVAGDSRDELRRFLVSRRIFCPIHWPLGHLPESLEWAPERRLASEILTLPVDQRMEPPHLEHLTNSLKEFFAEAA